MSVAAPPRDGRRAIAERNVASILDAAIHLLARSPEAGVSEIAAAAGVGRATVYRHFPTRDDLVAAIRKRARADVVAAVEAAEPESGDPLEALRRVVAASLATADRYRVVHGENRLVPARSDSLARHVFALVERAQREGALDPETSVTWIAGTLRALARVAFEEIGARRMGADEAADLVIRTLVSGLAPAR